MNDRKDHDPKPRVGPRMRELADIVSAMPGCSKSDALRAAGLPTHGLGSGRELDRAIVAGLIIVEYERVNLCRLFAGERDRRLWYLRHELLRPGTPAERVAEIRAEMNVLEAGRVATWADQTGALHCPGALSNAREEAVITTGIVTIGQVDD